MSRHSTLYIDKKQFINNIDEIKKYLHPGQEIVAIVKANAYGTGAVKASKIFQSQGINFFAVACIDEAVELRQNGITGKILVLSPFFENEIQKFIDHKVTPTITDYYRAELLSKISKQNKLTTSYHFKMDTGMGRLGPCPKEALKTILKIENLTNIKMEGLFSHFPTADLLDDFTNLQIKKFKDFIRTLKEKKINPAYKHLANSSGAIAFNDPFFNLIRPGIILYGTYPSDEIKKKYKTNHIATWKSKIIYKKKMKKNQSISYGKTYILEKDMDVAVIPVGYADGFSTLNSNNGFVYIKNKKCNILGRICMDYFIVDITKIDAAIEDEVLIYGDHEGIRVEDISKRTGLIPYEILTNISTTINRIYI